MLATKSRDLKNGSAEKAGIIPEFWPHCGLSDNVCNAHLLHVQAPGQGRDVQMAMQSLAHGSPAAWTVFKFAWPVAGPFLFQQILPSASVI